MGVRINKADFHTASIACRINLCLMKLSAYHKAQGDTVEWWKPAGWYDVVYKSRVFTDSRPWEKSTKARLSASWSNSFS